MGRPGGSATLPAGGSAERQREKIMSKTEIDNLTSEIKSRWQEHEAKQKQIRESAEAAFEPVAKHIEDINEALRRDVQRSAEIKLVKPWSIVGVKARCEYEVTMDGVDKPSTLSFLAGERFVEFKNKKWGTHDIVKVLLGLIRTELSKALKPPKV